LGLCGLYVVVQQYRNRFFSTFEWPSHFDRVHELAWLSIVLLVADVLVELLRGRTSAGEDADHGAPSDGVEPSETPATVP
jgi:hypothetical protein